MTVLLLLVLLVLVLNNICTNSTRNSTTNRAEESTTGLMRSTTRSATTYKRSTQALLAIRAAGTAGTTTGWTIVLRLAALGVCLSRTLRRVLDLAVLAGRVISGTLLGVLGLRGVRRVAAVVVAALLLVVLMLGRGAVVLLLRLGRVAAV